MKAKGVQVYLSDNQPGFTLPSNIGELGDDITQLDLSHCSLKGQLSIRVLSAPENLQPCKSSVCSLTRAQIDARIDPDAFLKFLVLSVTKTLNTKTR